MKHPLLFTVAILFFFSCTEEETTTDFEQVSTLQNSESIPQNIIPMSEAMQKIQSYQISKTEELEANSAHMEIEELKTYLAFAESKMDEVGKDLSGLEVYFGRYLDEEEGHHLKGQLCLIYFPTFKNNEGHNIPFDFVSEKAVSNIYRDFIKEDGLQARSSGSSAWNKLHMSPPRQPTSL